MSFREKVVWVMLVIMVVVYGGYFASVLQAVNAGIEVSEIAYRRAMLGTVITVVCLSIVGTIAVTIVSRGDDAEDERDREIDRYGASLGAVVLAVGVLGGLALAMIGAAHFWIANVLLLSLVLAEIAAGLRKVIRYRSGV
ncbi:MAG: hypothetical protein P8Y52_07435 [Xanthomonadales bacterium]